MPPRKSVPPSAQAGRRSGVWVRAEDGEDAFVVTARHRSRSGSVEPREMHRAAAPQQQGGPHGRSRSGSVEPLSREGPGEAAPRWQQAGTNPQVRKLRDVLITGGDHRGFPMYRSSCCTRCPHPLQVEAPVPQSYEASLGSQLNEFVFSVALDSSTHGQAVFALRDCKLDSQGGFVGLQVVAAYRTDCSLHALNPALSLLQMKQFVHVYRFPLRFSDTEACSFLCDCGAMQHAWEVLPGVDTSTVSFSDFQQRLSPCVHATAIRALHDCGKIPYGSSPEQASSRLRDVTFDCASQPITVLQSSPQHLLLSCDFGGDPCEAMTRAVIRTDRNWHYACCLCSDQNCAAHVLPLGSWIASLSESGSSGELFESFSLKAHATQQGHPVDDGTGASPSYRCVSSCRIPLDFHNAALESHISLPIPAFLLTGFTSGDM